MTTVLLTSTSGPLSDDAARSVRELVALETERLGVPPLSEQPLLNLRDPRARVVHIMDTQGAM